MGDDIPLKTSIEAPIGWLTVDRPELRGAMTRAMWLRIPQLLSELAASPDVSVIVIRGAGGHFIAGADIAEFTELRSNPELAREYDRGADATLETLADLDVPSIAMIEGACMGGGCRIAFGCDLRIASTSARFGIPAGRLGLAYPYKGVERLVALLGEARALELLLTARIMDAAEAERAGLVQSVVPPASLEVETTRVAGEIARNAPLALRYARLAVRRAAPARADLRKVQELADECFRSADYAEGVAAFLAKRPPRFSGR